jgi:hypothetical protein
MIGADMEEYQSMHYTQLLIIELLASAEFRERIAAFIERNVTPSFNLDEFVLKKKKMGPP